MCLRVTSDDLTETVVTALEPSDKVSILAYFCDKVASGRGEEHDHEGCGLRELEMPFGASIRDSQLHYLSFGGLTGVTHGLHERVARSRSMGMSLMWSEPCVASLRLRNKHFSICRQIDQGPHQR